MTTASEIVSSDDRDSWLEARNSGIGASEIAAVLGESPYSSRLRIWGQKIGRIEPMDLSDVEAVQMGLELEPWVAKHYENRTGRNVDRAGVLLRSDEYPWALATPDYWLMDEHGNWRIPLQIKTTSAWRVSDWDDGPPKHVWWQVQHEMFVTGAPWASIGVLIGGQHFRWTDVQRDEDAIQRIIVEGGAFWHQVETQEYPDLDTIEDTSQVIHALFPSAAEGENVALPTEAVEWDSELGILKSQRSELDARIQELENNLKMALGPAEKGFLDDNRGAYTYKNQERWSYSLADGQEKPSESGAMVTAIAKRTEFRVLRRTNG